MDFTNPVASVSIDAVAKSLNDLARLSIYDANDNLLARYTTSKLAAGQFETMTLSRPTADIAYAIAGAHEDRTILLDNLRFGPQSSTLTDAFGVYRLPYLEPGTYNVQVVPASGDRPTGPLNGQQMVTLTAGQAIGGIDFGVSTTASPWQNPSNRFDVNDNGVVDPNDVLRIINNLNSFGPHQLTNEPTPPYYDVDGNGLVTAIDVLQVINEINSRGNGEGESISAPMPTPTPPSIVPFPEAEGSQQPGNTIHFATSFDILSSHYLARSTVGLGNAEPSMEHTRPGSQSVPDEHHVRPASLLHRPTETLLQRTLAAHDEVMQQAAENDEPLLQSDLDDALVGQLAEAILGRL